MKMKYILITYRDYIDFIWTAYSSHIAFIYLSYRNHIENAFFGYGLFKKPRSRGEIPRYTGKSPPAEEVSGI